MAMLVATDIGKTIQCLSIARAIHELNLLNEDAKGYVAAKHICDNEVEIAIGSLARVLDKHRDAISIWKLIDYAEQNRHDFLVLVGAQNDFSVYCKQVRDTIARYDYLIKQIEETRDKSLAHTGREWLGFEQYAAEQTIFDVHALSDFCHELSEIVKQFSEGSEYFGNIDAYFELSASSFGEAFKDLFES